MSCMARLNSGLAVGRNLVVAVLDMMGNFSRDSAEASRCLADVSSMTHARARCNRSALSSQPLYRPLLLRTQWSRDTSQIRGCVPFALCASQAVVSSAPADESDHSVSDEENEQSTIHRHRPRVPLLGERAKLERTGRPAVQANAPHRMRCCRTVRVRVGRSLLPAPGASRPTDLRLLRAGAPVEHRGHNLLR